MWFYAKDGQQQGPVPEEQLKRLFTMGQLRPTDLVWKEGLPDWVRAETIPGLVPSLTTPAAAAPAPLPMSAPVQQTPRQYSPEEDDYERGQRGYDNWERDRPRQKSAAGGIIAGLLIAGVVLAVIVAGSVGAWFWWNWRYATEGTRTWNLKTNEKEQFWIYCRQDHIVELRVDSKRRSDVDLYVFDGGRKLLQDESLKSDCALNFRPTQNKNYKIVVWNRHLIPDPNGRNGPNEGSLHFKHVKLNKANRKPPRIVQPPPKGGKGDDIKGKDILNTRGILNRGKPMTYNVTLTANVTYTISLESGQFDPVVEVLDEKGKFLDDDDDGGIGRNSRLRFLARRTGRYQIRVVSFGGLGSGQFHLRVQE